MFVIRERVYAHPVFRESDLKSLQITEPNERTFNFSVVVSQLIISFRECHFDYWPWALKTLATSLLPILFPVT